MNIWVIVYKYERFTFEKEPLTVKENYSFIKTSSVTIPELFLHPHSL